MLAGPRPRIITFLSATPEDDKGAMLVNLGASLSQAGTDVLVVDACQHEYGVARRLHLHKGPSLLQVARQECALDEIVRAAPQGFPVASLARIPRGGVPMNDDDARRLANAFEVLAKQGATMLVDGEFGSDGSFPVPLMASSEIVVQVSTGAASISNALALIKRLAQHLGRRPFGILVTGASEAQAQVVYDNMAAATSRYLAVPLVAMGSVPADEYLQRAARLGRAVVDAFPMAGASAAFRQLAGRLALAGAGQAGR